MLLLSDFWLTTPNSTEVYRNSIFVTNTIQCGLIVPPDLHTQMKTSIHRSVLACVNDKGWVAHSQCTSTSFLGFCKWLLWEPEQVSGVGKGAEEVMCAIQNLIAWGNHTAVELVQIFQLLKLFDEKWWTTSAQELLSLGAVLTPSIHLLVGKQLLLWLHHIFGSSFWDLHPSWRSIGFLPFFFHLWVGPILKKFRGKIWRESFKVFLPLCTHTCLSSSRSSRVATVALCGGTA